MYESPLGIFVCPGVETRPRCAGVQLLLPPETEQEQGEGARSADQEDRE